MVNGAHFLNGASCRVPQPPHDHWMLVKNHPEPTNFGASNFSWRFQPIFKIFVKDDWCVIQKDRQVEISWCVIHSWEIAVAPSSWSQSFSGFVQSKRMTSLDTLTCRLEQCSSSAASVHGLGLNLEKKGRCKVCQTHLNPPNLRQIHVKQR